MTTGGPVTLEVVDGALDDDEVLVVGAVVGVVVGVVAAHNWAIVTAANWSYPVSLAWMSVLAHIQVQVQIRATLTGSVPYGGADTIVVKS